ncbi:MAG TPA: DUF2203 domain-containing protein [Kofleriaceae bacterium]|nr:DUF2203 domain-containing protein [Kofleriaceae bacterium]
MAKRARKHYFTVAEANAKVSDVAAGFQQVLQIRALLKNLYARLEAAGYPMQPAHLEGVEDEAEAPAAVIADRARFRGLAQALKEQIEMILATGCVIKDVESGLVDFPALCEGREVWLCWRLGERGVDFWHEHDRGFADRRPVSELSPATAVCAPSTTEPPATPATKP